jgi:hypothetical protein
MCCPPYTHKKDVTGLVPPPDESIDPLVCVYKCRRFSAVVVPAAQILFPYASQSHHSPIAETKQTSNPLRGM